MNWQPLDVQPFDPKNYRTPVIERRRRLMGKPVREIVRPQTAPFVGVQQDYHVRAWEKWKLSMPIGRLSRYVFTRCIELGANFNDVIGPRRSDDLIKVRHLLMWELRNLMDPTPSYPEIGRAFGGKDHTSVIWTVQQIEAKKRAGEL